MSADGSAKRPLESGLVYDEGDLAFSPDGEEVAYRCSPRSYGNNEDICTARVDGSGFRNLTKTRQKVEHHFAWSPSGEWLAFVSEKCRDLDCPGEDGPRIESSATFKVRADGTSLTRLTPDRREADSDLAWSPDGKRIAFVRWEAPLPVSRVAYTSVFTMRPDGTSLTRLTKVSGYEDDPAWSPGGTHLAYGFSAGQESGLLGMRADGTEKVRLTDGNDRTALWSPDGRRIAFVRNEDTLYTMRADGSDERVAARAAGYYLESFDWQPRP